MPSDRDAPADRDRETDPHKDWKRPPSNDPTWKAILTTLRCAEIAVGRALDATMHEAIRLRVYDLMRGDEALASAREEGRREGIEDAADRLKLEAGKMSNPTRSESLRLLSKSIRALAPTPEAKPCGTCAVCEAWIENDSAPNENPCPAHGGLETRALDALIVRALAPTPDGKPCATCDGTQRVYYVTTDTSAPCPDCAGGRKT